MSVPATMTSVSAQPGSGTEGIGKTITVKVKFSKAVTVSGAAPELALDDGGFATYSGGSGTNTLIFTYQVGAGDSSVAALAVTGIANGGSILDSTGDATDFTNLPKTFTGLKIDTITPTVTQAVALPASGDEGVGKTITIKLTLSEAVKVSGGAPTLLLNDGGVATYKSGSGSNTLTFSYQVGAGDSNVAALGITGTALNGATVADLAGNQADFSAATTSFSGPEIDTTPPTVTMVASQPATGDETVGSSVTITLTFDEAVTVAGGKPSLTLNDGGTATYKSGSGTDTLTFTYKVGASDVSVPDLAVLGASTNGATIKDALGNIADLSGATATFTGLAVTATPDPYSFFTLNAGGSTTATGINNLGQVVGNYSPSGGGELTGFLYSGGIYSSVGDDSLQTAAGINNAGQIVGTFGDNGFAGYVESSDGSDFTTLADSNQFGSFNSTHATGINNEGQIVGWYQTSSGDNAFIYNNGLYADLPTPTGTYGSYIYGINDSDTYVGTFIDSSLTAHGFIGHFGETPTQLDDPLASAAYGGTYAEGINDEGQVVGYYFDAAGNAHGFLYNNGTYTTIDDPNGGFGDTILSGINDAGQIVGTADGNGFVATAGIDLTDIAFGPGTTLGYQANGNNTGGTITVNDGTHNATITVMGQYAASDFHLANDFSGGTYVTDPSLSGAALTSFLSSQHT